MKVCKEVVDGDQDKVFSVPEIHIMMNEAEYIKAIDLITTAAGLFGDGGGGDLGINSEYERGMSELIVYYMGWPTELVIQVTEAIHCTAIINKNQSDSTT